MGIRLTAIQDSLADRAGQAEANYFDIFENALEGIYQITWEGRLITANPALARIYGYASPEELFLEQEFEGKVQEIINRLSPKLRLVIVLRYNQELSYEEISKIIDVPLGTVKSRVNRARLRLQGPDTLNPVRSGEAIC